MFLQKVEVAPDLDFGSLAKMAEGYSGDDISGVCRDSAMASLRRKVAGKTPAEIRSSLVQVPAFLTASCLAGLLPAQAEITWCHKIEPGNDIVCIASRYPDLLQ